VSGDYCDYVTTASGDLYFMVGDISGKGVAASMLMSHLHATLRTLVVMDLPLHEVMERASRLFCESALSAQYATLVCGKASRTGRVEVSNAGHPPPLLIRDTGVDRVGATGLPVGLFHSERFEVAIVDLAPRDMFLLYTDGVVDAEDRSGADYGVDRLSAVASRARRSELVDVLDACARDVAAFRGGARRADDATVMGIKRQHALAA
jgi:sigma-B regulation protein RsbU (phosphoserine phosphatase)